jgi:hypothetical protein
MRARRIRNFSKVIEAQHDYDLFQKKKTIKKRILDLGEKSEKEDKNWNYVIKWTNTSDQSTIFMDFVKVNVDRLQKKMNWEMKFPIRFVICKGFLDSILIE